LNSRLWLWRSGERSTVAVVLDEEIAEAQNTRTHVTSNSDATALWTVHVHFSLLTIVPRQCATMASASPQKRHRAVAWSSIVKFRFHLLLSTRPLHVGASGAG